MYGKKDLKKRIEISEYKVECPVLCCNVEVQRQRGTFKRKEEFLCSEHDIYISPSTFEYGSVEDNLLYSDSSDVDLLRRIEKTKRESRMSRDNSEDAVTWNLLRGLEKENSVSNFLSDSRIHNCSASKLFWWTYDPKEDEEIGGKEEKETADREGRRVAKRIYTNIWKPMLEGRKHFGENEKKGTEPDLIIETEDEIIFVEMKFTSDNNTKPKGKSFWKYERKDKEWYNTVLKSRLEEVAIGVKRYELLRHWLLGTWISHFICRKRYVLLNIVPEEILSEGDDCFRKCIIEDDKKKFIIGTWGQIIRILNEEQRGGVYKKVLEYLKDKTRGYNSNGKLVSGFAW